LRLFYGILSLIFISFVVFIADELAPGDAANVLAGDKATAAQLESLRHQMGLDRPWPIRYVEFLGNAAKFDFGKSYFGTKRPVGELLAEKLPLTALIALCAIVVASAVGIGLGTIAGIYRTRPPDTAILLASTLGVTIPTFVLAPIMVYYFSTVKDVLPATWDPNPTAPIWMYLLMPVLILAARPAALLTRLTRASMIETLQQEFIRTDCNRKRSSFPTTHFPARFTECHPARDNRNRNELWISTHWLVRLGNGFHHSWDRPRWY